jgi:hypothetical protein
MYVQIRTSVSPDHLLSFSPPSALHPRPPQLPYNSLLYTVVVHEVSTRRDKALVLQAFR